MRLVFTSILFSCFAWAFSQSGPGGVGNSASNVLWLDANKDVATSGAAVLTWNDQSGNTNHAYSGTVAQRPQLVTSTVNGFPAIRFDGTDDFLSVTDHPSLDLQEWHIFMVVKVSVHKNFNTWFTKGTYLQENYCLLSYVNGNLRSPIRFTDGNITVANTVGGQVTNTEYNIIEYSYSPAYGRDIYKNNTPVFSDDNNKIPATNNASLVLGFETGFGDRYLDGNIAEMIIFNERLPGSKRLIINNYLAAKYDKMLASNDFYDEDNVGFDFDVAGIGRIDATNLNNDAMGSIVRILNPSNLNDNEFLLWGHDNGEIQAVNITDVPTGVMARSDRVWRVSERNTTNTMTVDVGAVDMQFDLTGLGPVTATDLRLLIDTDDDGIFADETPISGAMALGGNIYQFTALPGTTLSDNRRFTIATINQVQTPLPVELLTFDAVVEADQSVLLLWQTASEMNNDFFTLERAADGASWEELATIDGAGNSSEKITYQWLDRRPLLNESYYRLKQTDFNGDISYSDVRMVRIEQGPGLSVFPNPFVNAVNLRSNVGIEHVNIYSADGRLAGSFIGDSLRELEIDLAELPNGLYLLELKTAFGSEAVQIVKE